MLSRRRVVTMFGLALASAICLLMLLARVLVSESTRHGYLWWNLILAWIPFLLALWLYDRYRKRPSAGALLTIGIAWLAFLPNAPYLITDLVHLKHVAGQPIPIWYDAVLLGLASWTGLLLGLISIYLVQAVVRSLSNELIGWWFAVIAIAASGFGMYLGRFQRFNSWEVLSDPGPIVGVFLDSIRDPLANPRPIGATVIYTALISVGYIVLYSLAHPQLAAELEERR